MGYINVGFWLLVSWEKFSFEQIGFRIWLNSVSAEDNLSCDSSRLIATILIFVLVFNSLVPLLMIVECTPFSGTALLSTECYQLGNLNGGGRIWTQELHSETPLSWPLSAGVGSSIERSWLTVNNWIAVWRSSLNVLGVSPTTANNFPLSTPYYWTRPPPWNPVPLLYNEQKKKWEK